MMYDDLSKTFVANRVQQIKANTTSGQWFYIPTKKILHVVSLGDWILLKWILLIPGFKALLFSWQDMKFVQVEMSIQSFQMMIRNWGKILHFAVHLSEDAITSTDNRVSSWLKLKRVIALVVLHKRKLPELVKTNQELSPEIHRMKLVGLTEIQKTELEIIKSVQSRYFGEKKLPYLASKSWMQISVI